MLARRTLLQLATKLAIGLGALFLVGVLLAAIPHHRAPVVQGISAGQGQEAMRPDHVTPLGAKKDKKKSRVADIGQDATHENAAARKAGDSAK